ncbi:MAG: response regulator [bacterium]
MDKHKSGEGESQRRGLLDTFLKRSLGRTLLFWFLTLSILPLIVVGIINYRNTEKNLRNASVEKLHSIVEFKSELLQQYFMDYITDLSRNADLPSYILFMKKLNEAYMESGKTLNGFVNSPKWTKIIDENSGDIRHWAKANSYYDVLLIDVKGNILFTVKGEKDLSTNIFANPESSSILSKACRESIETGHISFSDFGYYAFSNQYRASFMVSPIGEKEGKPEGFLVIQLPEERFDEIISRRIGFGVTEESFLIGTDLRVRFLSSFNTGSLKFMDTVMTNQTQLFHERYPVRQQSTNQVELDSNKDHVSRVSEYVNRNGVNVLGTHYAIIVLGIPFAVVAQVQTSEAFAAANHMRNTTIVSLCITSAVVLLLSLLISLRIIKPVRNLTQVVTRIADGDLTSDICDIPKNEIGQVALSVNKMISSSREAVSRANDIAMGDYSGEIKLRSDRDELGIALNTMTKSLQSVSNICDAISQGDLTKTLDVKSENDLLGNAINRMVGNLKRVTSENNKQNWLKSSQAELSEQILGEQDITSLARNVITCLAKLLKMQVGAIYQLVSGNKLKLVGSYAYTERKNLANEFKLGQGLVGQAALEGEFIQLSNVPDDYIKIVSGLGETSPKYILAVPFRHEGVVKGIIELGSLEKPNEQQVELLKIVGESIAVAFTSTESRHRMQELLQESQRQGEELQAQSEELQSQSEELQNQSQELQASNEELEEKSERLKQQTEELQASNEELEEKSEAIQRQKIDVDRRNKQLETIKAELEEKASDLKLASSYKSEFLANMSHELRTPLNSLLILSQSLAENSSGNLDKDQVESARIIKSSGQDLLNLINEILDLSKVESGKLELQIDDLDLKSILGMMENQFNPIASNKGVEFKTKLGDGLPQNISTDQMRIEQILRNLLSNAFKFTKKGSVELRIEKPDSEMHFKDCDLMPPAAVCFAVTDTGIGIPLDKQKSIFEAFQQADGTTSREYGGTGLGLTVSRELARKLGGEIQLQSHPGEGSTFSLYLPVSYMPVSQENDKACLTINNIISESNNLKIKTPYITPSRTESHDFIPDDRHTICSKDKVILVIEDDPVFARILLSLAHGKGYKALASGNARSGMQCANEFVPAAILLDLGLPDMDGLNVLDNLKHNLKTRHIPVHVISGRAKKTASLEKGAIGFLTKPCQSEDINEVFTKIENMREKEIKHLLVIEDDEKARYAIHRLFENKSLHIVDAASGEEAIKQLRLMTYDCIILDLLLGDMTGFELLKIINDEESFLVPPVIIYTGKELTHEEHQELKHYAESIVVKGAESPERLLDEVSLFLHSVESSLPPDQRKVIRMLHDTDQALRGKRILMVDDDLRNTFALSKVLKDYELDITLANNGQMALDKMNTELDFDLVLMDIMMPIMDGFEAMRIIRKEKRFAKLPIIALTAKAMPSDRLNCLEAGANDYLTKPVDVEKLMSLMRVWLFQPETRIFEKV